MLRTSVYKAHVLHGFFKMTVDDSSLAHIFGQSLHTYTIILPIVPTLKWVFKCFLKWVSKN